jgi:hypothetical protein
MMPPTDELFPVLNQLREWLDNDVSQLLRHSRTPAPYGAALCIIVGCEALSRLLKEDPPHGIFARELIQYHRKSFTLAMGKDIFQALRNGLAHIYDTELLRIGLGGPEVGLIVSWKDYSHLELVRKGQWLGLVLHVPTMWEDLQRVMNSALGKTKKGDGQLISKNWKDSRVWEASDLTLAGWAKELGVAPGQPIGKRSQCRRP